MVENEAYVRVVCCKSYSVEFKTSLGTNSYRACSNISGGIDYE